MPNIISFVERSITPKGLNPENKINQTQCRNYFFDDDYQNLKLLDYINLNLQTLKPTLFYPGSGNDVLFPLHYVEKLFPNIKEIKFIFVDLDNNLGLIKTILDDLGVHFSEQSNFIQFYWNKLQINLEFITANVFNLDLPSFDIYFEKAFRIIKDQDPSYEHRIFEKLSNQGILISDSGFQQTNLKKITVPAKLSSYKEMIIGIKLI